MSRVRLICYSDSKENFAKSVKYKVIGTKRRCKFDQADKLYFILKDSGVWKICASADADKKTDVYPFSDAYPFYTFGVKNVKLCEPFEIAAICRKYVGQYWGLNLKFPAPIEDSEFANELDSHFKEITYQQFTNIIELPEV